MTILPNKPAKIYKQKWRQFLFFVKSHCFKTGKQQISKFYQQILNAEISFYTDRPLTVV